MVQKTMVKTDTVKIVKAVVISETRVECLLPDENSYRIEISYDQVTFSKSYKIALIFNTACMSCSIDDLSCTLKVLLG